MDVLKVIFDNLGTNEALKEEQQKQELDAACELVNKALFNQTHPAHELVKEFVSRSVRRDLKLWSEQEDQRKADAVADAQSNAIVNELNKAVEAQSLQLKSLQRTFRRMFAQQ